MITKKEIMEKLSLVEDPELGIDIVSLGLIYEVKIEGRKVNIKMTLTTPACPLIPTLLGDIENRCKELEGVDEVFIDLVWDPPWNPEMMSDEAKIKMGFV